MPARPELIKTFSLFNEILPAAQIEPSRLRAPQVRNFPPALFELHDSSEVGTAQRDFNT
eukprot:CAMPEP_0173108026 /NCGR_PEP_ID=MMETSP1102-20130122/42373_1 /TAXON_ID=49646 /ORGANISM="Geminigera sp., Strain Caron Lab Isolate" /LENGTH=58 /DNA_ID=CAMNT_0014006219 /DNA_START=144 /DNA_END=320 /DNA_ORIENTATION=-